MPLLTPSDLLESSISCSPSSLSHLFAHQCSPHPVAILMDPPPALTLCPYESLPHCPPVPPVAPYPSPPDASVPVSLRMPPSSIQLLRCPPAPFCSPCLPASTSPSCPTEPTAHPQHYNMPLSPTACGGSGAGGAPLYRQDLCSAIGNQSGFA